jgi:hypothetical protein
MQIKMIVEPENDPIQDQTGPEIFEIKPEIKDKLPKDEDLRDMKTELDENEDEIMPITPSEAFITDGGDKSEDNSTENQNIQAYKSVGGRPNLSLNRKCQDCNKLFGHPS